MSGIDQYTKALLHFSGSDGGTSVIESITNTILSSSFTGSSISNSSKFGTGYYGSTSTSSLNISVMEPYFQYGSDNWTIDFWGKYGNTLGTPVWYNDGVIQIVYNNSYFHVYQIDNTNTFRFDNNHQHNSTVNTLAFSHFAIQRSGSVIQLYQDGILKDGTIATAYTLYPSASIRQIGFTNGNASLSVDEVRVSVGVARYNTNFTPPTSEYTNDIINVQTNITSSILTEALLDKLETFNIEINITSSISTLADLNRNIHTDTNITSSITTSASFQIKSNQSSNIDCSFWQHSILSLNINQVNTNITSSFSIEDVILYEIIDETEKLTYLLQDEVLYPVINEEIY